MQPQKENTHKIIGLGETVYDIILNHDGSPVSAKPGGSAFNALISLGRRGLDCSFISEVGDDQIGRVILDFLAANGVESTSVSATQGTKSPLAIAFLDNDRNAHYQFYKDTLSQQIQPVIPHFRRGDALLISSYFAINPNLRHIVSPVLDIAKGAGALVYYDVNFRSTHRYELPDLLPNIYDNFAHANIVKGSDEDFQIMFDIADPEEVYRRHVAQHCPVLIYTQGSDGATIITPHTRLHVPSKKIKPVSTIGAGDNFNAGFLYGLVKEGLTSADIATLDAKALNAPMQTAIDFAAEVCLSMDNYVKPSTN